MALDYKSSLSRYRNYVQLVRSRPLWTASVWVMMSLVLLIVLLVLALRPTLVTISGLVGQVRQEKDISLKLDKKIAIVQQALTEMNSVENRKYLLETALPTEADWKGLVDSFQKIATDSGLETVDIIISKIPLAANEGVVVAGKQTTQSVPTGVIPVKFSLNMTGNYAQMRKAVGELENMGRVIMLNYVEINSDKEDALTLFITGEGGYMSN